jgi:PDZ domain-containing secreted protein
LTNAAGCDSTVTLDLTINYSNTGTDVITACDSYTWIDGITYTSSNNTATHVLTNAAGCDSTVTLDLTINYSNTGTDVITACDSYTWIDGVTYTSSNNTATHVLTNAAGCDSTVTLDLTINYSNTGTDVITACDSYTWIDGITYTSSNNTATHVLTNAAGCDSTVTLNLTIKPMPNVNVTQTGTTLSSEQLGANYQWMDCDNGFSWISGATGASFTPTATIGNYAVEINLDGCIDTSTCYLIDYTHVEDIAPTVISIHPNPAQYEITIQGFEVLHGIQSVEVTTTTGQVLLRLPSVGGTIDVSSLPPAVYFVNILHRDGFESMRFVKH